MISQALLIFPAIIATAISILFLTWLAQKSYQRSRPQTLSMMAASSKMNLSNFRLILYVCAVLFGITIWFYIAPRTPYSYSVKVAAVAMCLSDIILAAIPVRGTWERVAHTIFGYVMGTAMAILAWLFAASTSGGPQLLEIAIITLMLALAIGAYVDKRRFVFYELPYIYLSHVSIVVIAIALLKR